MSNDIAKLMAKIKSPPANHTPNIRAAGSPLIAGAALAYVLAQLPAVKSEIAKGVEG